MRKYHIFDKLILAGGPPRSGTTLLAKVLNSHPEIVTAIDNGVYENWGLYYYRSRTGLIRQLRSKEMSADEINRYLLDHIVKDNQLWGAASSSKMAGYPLIAPPSRPDSNNMGDAVIHNPSSVIDKVRQIYKWVFFHFYKGQKPPAKKSGIVRHSISLETFEEKFRLCLKSPEIVFVLSKLSIAFPHAKFILVHRPIIEIAESMYRKGSEWHFGSYHKRWNRERNENGERIPPPGVPPEWDNLWKTVSDFQRCAIYAASYLRAMVSETINIPSDKVFIYNHKMFCANPSKVIAGISGFLNADFDGFEQAFNIIRDIEPVIPNKLKIEYSEIESEINMPDIEAQAERISSF